MPVRLVPESEKGVAMAAGAFTLALFGVGLAIVHVATPTELGRRELVGFGIGFGLFMAIYFVSMSADSVLMGDDYRDRD